MHKEKLIYLKLCIFVLLEDLSEHIKMQSLLNLMQKIQKFGGAMFTPVLLFAFAGIVIGIGT